MRPPRASTSAYPLLLALGALDATGYSVIVPVAPAISEQTGAGPATIGLLVASFPAGMIAGFALAGALVRRRGSRALLVGSITLVAVGALGFVAGDSLEVYFPARALMGLGSGGIWIGVTFDTLERWPGLEYPCQSGRAFGTRGASLPLPGTSPVPETVRQTGPPSPPWGHERRRVGRIVITARRNRQPAR